MATYRCFTNPGYHKSPGKQLLLQVMGYTYVEVRQMNRSGEYVWRCNVDLPPGCDWHTLRINILKSAHNDTRNRIDRPAIFKVKLWLTAAGGGTSDPALDPPDRVIRNMRVGSTQTIQIAAPGCLVEGEEISVDDVFSEEFEVEEDVTTTPTDTKGPDDADDADDGPPEIIEEAGIPMWVWVAGAFLVARNLK
jgi:hypothetical protein